MSAQSRNDRYFLKQWLIIAFFLAIVVGLCARDINRGDQGMLLAAAGLVLLLGGAVAWGLIVPKRRLAKALQAPDPAAYLTGLAKSLNRMPHGTYLAAAETATLLALYGRTHQAEAALSQLPAEAVPPFFQSMEPRARAFIAYAEGRYQEGLAFAELALSQGVVSGRLPGSGISSLASRTCRNLGLALLGEETPATMGELREARSRLPLTGQLIAAWGLAAAAKRAGHSTEFLAMRQFIQSAAPHFSPVLKNLGDPNPD